MKQRHADLQLHEDLRLQHREWRVQKVSWFLLYALLVAIAFGLLGHGPLSNSQVRSPAGGTLLEFDRFMTVKSTNRLTLTLQPSNGEVRAVLDAKYLQDVEIKEIRPEPEKSVLESEGTAYIFSANSQKPMRVHFSFEPRNIGMLEGWIAVAGEPRLKFKQFVYP
jgi:hypothetical protein